MNVLDLFSGIGGFSLGLERAGMKTVAFCEIDRHARKVLKKHWPDIPIYEDVRKIKGTDFENIDLICGGFPCQDISVAGGKRGFKDEHGNRTRSGLWKEFKRVIKEIKPRYALIENVANLRNIGLNQVIKDLWTIGYGCEWHIISARSVGAPHLRERIWIIAYPTSKGLEGYNERRSSFETIQKKKLSFFSHNNASAELTNANMSRFWQPFASEEEKSQWWTEATSCFSSWWETEPTICRVDDGLPSRLDKNRSERIKQLGNSVVPQIVEFIGKEILKYENNNNAV